MCAAMVLVYKNQETSIAVTKCLDILLRTTIYLLHLTNVVLRIVYQGYWINVEGDSNYQKWNMDNLSPKSDFLSK